MNFETDLTYIAICLGQTEKAIRKIMILKSPDIMSLVEVIQLSPAVELPVRTFDDPRTDHQPCAQRPIVSCASKCVAVNRSLKNRLAEARCKNDVACEFARMLVYSDRNRGNRLRLRH